MEHDRAAGLEWLGRLARELDERHLPSLVASMEEAVTHAVPAYALFPVEGSLRQGLRQTAKAYSRTLVEMRRLDGRERLALHVIGSQRARHGLDPQDMESAVDTAVRVGWAFALRVLRSLGATVETFEEVSAEGFALTIAFRDDVREGLLIGHRMNSEEQLPAQVRIQATVIDQLLAGGDEHALNEAVRAQSLDIRTPCGLVLVMAGGSGGDSACLRTAATAVARLPKAVEGGRRSAPAPHVVVLLTAAVAEWQTVLSLVDQCAREHGVVALASEAPVDRLEELAPAYGKLATDLHLAPRARRGSGVVSRRQLGLYRVLSHVPPEERIEYVADVLGAVKANGEKGRTYLVAYEGWVEANCNAEAAGALLNEPAHTIRYRVKKFEELTGIPVRSAEGRLRIDLAIRLDRAWVEEVFVDRHERTP